VKRGEEFLELHVQDPVLTKNKEWFFGLFDRPFGFWEYEVKEQVTDKKQYLIDNGLLLPVEREILIKNQ
jgi:hypothetical protein